MLSYPIFFERIPRLGKKEKSPRAKYSENLRNGIRLAIKNQISDFPVQPTAGAVTPMGIWSAKKTRYSTRGSYTVS
jgi:hypothetical protein